MIPYGRQDINQSDIDSVIEVLQSDYITQGPIVERFEDSVSDFCQAKYAVAVNSATSALHIAVIALGLQAGDILWTSPVTFVASANCALYCGANIDFVDIDPRTLNICPKALTSKLKHAERTGTLPKVVVVVHMAGHSADMQQIASIVRRHGIKLIEDASHAIGGFYHHKPVGMCEYSDIVVFSFHPVKIITSAEGGMALTNTKQLADKMALLRSHGVTRDESQMCQKADGPWYYEQVELGWNYRMSELHAALGLSQSTRITEFVTCRNELATVYDELLSNFPIDLPVRESNILSSFHLYIIRLTDDVICHHSEIYKFLRTN